MQLAQFRSDIVWEFNGGKEPWHGAINLCLSSLFGGCLALLDFQNHGFGMRQNAPDDFCHPLFGRMQAVLHDQGRIERYSVKEERIK